MKSRFALGVGIAGAAILGYQVVNHLTADPGLWTHLPGIGVLALEGATHVTGNVWPAVGGVLLAIPLVLVSFVGVMIPMTEPPGWALDAYWTALLVMVLGLAYALYAGGRIGLNYWSTRRAAPE